MTSIAQSILITGASRGIGLEFVKQLIKVGPQLLIAGCRNPSEAKELQDIARENKFVKILKLDVENDEEIDAAVQETKTLVGDDGLNLLINNAGIFQEKQAGGGGGGGKVGAQNRANLQRHFNVNSSSPIIVTQKFLPLLEQAASNKKSLPLSCSKASSVILSTIMGSQSISHKESSANAIHYRCSKTAASMAGVLLGSDLKDSGILVFSLHPGWVHTDMGGPDGPVNVTESVEGMLNVLANAGEKDVGLLKTFKGDTLPF